MPPLTLDPLTLAVCGVAGILLGLVELLTGFSRGGRPWVRSLVLAGVLGLLAAAAFASDQPGYLWQPMLALMTLEVVLAGARAPWPALSRGKWSAVQAVALIAGGAGLLGWQLQSYDQEMAEGQLVTDELLAAIADPLDPDAAPTYFGRTDADNPVPLYSVPPGTKNTTPEAEARLLHHLQVPSDVMQTAPSDSHYNCHGWVFAGGRYWLRGWQVAGILKDNGYQLVTRPAAGDLAIYRDTAGEVAHTGLVRTCEAAGVLIESKWGRLGRYLHTPDGHAYRGYSVEYYHRSGGHLLRDAEYPRPGEPTVRQREVDSQDLPHETSE